MKILISIFFLIQAFHLSSAQSTHSEKSKPLTSKYEGIYSYGTGVEKSGVGTIIIYAETDSTILFYIDLNRGAPSYNMGSLYERVKIINGTGVLLSMIDKKAKGCKLTFAFLNHTLIIKTVEGQDNCGFGYGVNADGKFELDSNKKVDYFETMEGTKVYFKDTKPEDYNR